MFLAYIKESPNSNNSDILAHAFFENNNLKRKNSNKNIASIEVLYGQNLHFDATFGKNVANRAQAIEKA